MDRNSLIGILLIVALIFVYMKLNDDGEEQKTEKQKTETATKDKAAQKPAAGAAPAAPATPADSATLAKQKESNYGAYAQLATGKVQKVEVQTEELRMAISTKGGVPEAVYLNNFKTWDGNPLPIFAKSNANQLYLTLPYQGRVIQTKDLYFAYTGEGKVTVKGSEKKTLRFRAQVDSSSYLEYAYHLKGQGYDLDMEVTLVNMRNYVTGNKLELNAGLEIPKTEKDFTKMLPTAQASYGLQQQDEIDITYLDHSADEKVEEELNYSTRWVSFKSQFFQLAFIAPKAFEGNGKVTAEPVPVSRQEEAVKYMATTLSLPYTGQAKESQRWTVYMGPNNINILDDYNVDLDRTVRLGWGPLRYVTLFIIWVFHLLEGFIGSYGLIIFLLAIFIKVILLPLTLKSHVSMVKMQIVNNMPEIKDLEAKYKDNVTELQQRKMSFYRQVGVSPFGGCLPMLLQFPVLIAMFNFFPESIELRQQGLWWATDLSTYDSIWDFGKVPVINFLYGDHVSLFTLLMTISTLVYTYMQQKMQGNMGAAAAQMKWMGYLMPVLFLGILNNYAAALSYYYLVFNLLTIAQTYILKATISKEKLEAKVHETKNKKAGKPKGRMAKWLEDQQKKQQQMVRERGQQRGKKK